MTAADDALEFRRDLLIHQLSELQSAIRAYDAQLYQVRGWSITIGIAIAVATFQTKHFLIALLGVFSALVFWFLEGYIKDLQAVFIVHNRGIEQALRDRGVDWVLTNPDGLPQLSLLFSQAAAAHAAQNAAGNWLFRLLRLGDLRPALQQMREPQTLVIHGFLVVLQLVLLGLGMALIHHA